MRRLRLLLQGPLAAFVVVWAGVVAGVHMTPGATWTPFGVDLQEDTSGRDLSAPVEVSAQPLIAEVPGIRPEVPPAERASDQRGPTVLVGASGQRSRSRVEETAYRTGPDRAAFGVVTGTARCRLLCTYRL